jgi:hypothetical protein
VYRIRPGGNTRLDLHLDMFNWMVENFDPDLLERSSHAFAPAGRPRSH